MIMAKAPFAIRHELKASTAPGAGLGLFAAEPIKKGQLVWRFREEDHVIHDADSLAKAIAKMSYKDARQYLIHCYAYEAYDGAWRVAYEFDDGRYTNHSDTPNLGCRIGDLDVYALRDIASGEEIFEDYVADGCQPGPSWFQRLNREYGLPVSPRDFAPSKSCARCAALRCAACTGGSVTVSVRS